VTYDAADVVNLVLGSVEVALAVVVLRHLGRVGRAFPWLAALMAFFVLRGIDRIYAGLTDSERLGVVVDAVLVVVVFLLLFGIDKTVNALRAAQDEAAYRREEYARALADYKRLARHRLANPITAIQGSISTLKDMPELDEETRRALLDAAEGEARRLQEVALDPDVLRDEERTLEPRPNV
jgi:signal transduction histidine kinase